MGIDFLCNGAFDNNLTNETLDHTRYSYLRATTPRSSRDIPEGIFAYMEVEIPDNQVLLSDFISWHSPLNEGPLNDWKRIFKETDRLDKEAGRCCKKHH